MEEFVITIDCSGLIRQVNIQANTEQEAKVIAQKNNPHCKILDCSEYIKS